MTGYYVRVTIRISSSRTRKFWAKVEKRGRSATLYLPLKDDGDDKGFIRKDGVVVLPKELVSNSLIIKGEPARMNLKYGVLEVVRKR